MTANRIYYTQALDHRAGGRLRHRRRAQRLGRALLRVHQSLRRRVPRRISASSTRSRPRAAPAPCTWAWRRSGIGPGDEVILADTNWIATAAPIVHLGAKPVFVDILPDTWCIDPALAEAAITPRTKAIIAVHLYGNLCDMDRLLAIGEKHGIPVIEDAAEAIGSVYHGKRAGSMGEFGAFSFHGTKTLTTGEGGMFVTNDAELYERVLTLSNHGRARGQTRAVLARRGRLQVQDVEHPGGDRLRADGAHRRARRRASARSCATTGTARRIARRRDESRAGRHAEWRLDADGGVRAADRQ